MFLPTTDSVKNIEIATALLLDLGLKGFDFSGYSDTNGISVYFKTDEDLKIRVSDHGVTSTSRIQNEIHFNFDARTLKIDGTTGFRDNQKINRLFATNVYKL